MTVILMLKACEARPRTIAGPRCGSTCPRSCARPKPIAQRATSTVMRETYLTFARWTSAIAIVMWVLALLFSLAGK